MIRTLVVDDDFRVAEVNAAYVDKVPGFAVCGQAHTARDAERAIDNHRPDLVLLDLYLPDEHGLQLLRRIRSRPSPPDFMVITAARDADNIRAAMQLGAVHYLVKPFTFERLSEQLTAYRALHTSVARLQDASQEDVDRLYALMRPLSRAPKGTSAPTVGAVLETLRRAKLSMTAGELAEHVGISRPTAQRYLTHLLEAGLVQRDLNYGSTGRPSHRYRAK
jgi:response regulator of citrate/malate metabolism